MSECLNRFETVRGSVQMRLFTCAVAVHSSDMTVYQPDDNNTSIYGKSHEIKCEQLIGTRKEIFGNTFDRNSL